MKKVKQKVRFIILLTFCSFGVISQSIDTKDEKGLRHGIQKGYYTDSKILRYEGTFNHGKEQGLFTYYANSDKKIVMATRNFAKNNEAFTIFFDEKGNKVSEGNVKSKLRQGLWTYYHKDSKAVMTTENYLNDKLEGPRLVYHPNGKLAESVSYKNNLKNGISKIFSKEGILIEEAVYNNGMMQGVYKVFEDSGKLAVKGQFKNDVKKGMWYFYENDKLVREENKDLAKKTTFKKIKKI